MTKGPTERAPRPSVSAPPDPVAAGPIGERGRDAFLDILSHELRTPITTIYGGALLLATRQLAPAHARALADDVRMEADRLYRLVEDLVVLARSERDGIRPAREPVAIGQLVKTAVERELERHRGLEIEFRGGSDAAADGADETMVAHVVRNLLDNAMRYGDYARPIVVEVHVDPREVAVRVIDHGVPPDPDREPFELSAHPSATAAGRAGAGIGLYVADRLVRAMGGRMWATPSEPDGAEFGFALARFNGLRQSEV